MNIQCYMPGSDVVHCYTVTNEYSCYMPGSDVVHCYTVIPSSIIADSSNHQEVHDGRVLFMMIKIYRDGVLTPIIGQLRPGQLSLLSLSIYMF